MRGIQLRPLLVSVPDEQHGLFTATIRALIEGDYLRSPSDISVNDLPSEVALTDRARTVLEGWPGAAPEDLFQNFMAVLAERAAAEPDPSRKRRLERVSETVKELGVATASEVLAKVLAGGV